MIASRRMITLAATPYRAEDATAFKLLSALVTTNEAISTEKKNCDWTIWRLRLKVSSYSQRDIVTGLRGLKYGSDTFGAVLELWNLC